MKRDYLEVLKALEELIARGHVKERYDEKRGDLVYELTPEGEEFARKLMSDNVDAFDFIFAVFLDECAKGKAPVQAVIEFLLWWIYTIHYKLDPEEAKRRAKSWFTEE